MKTLQKIIICAGLLGFVTTASVAQEKHTEKAEAPLRKVETVSEIEQIEADIHIDEEAIRRSVREALEQTDVALESVMHDLEIELERMEIDLRRLETDLDGIEITIPNLDFDIDLDLDQHIESVMEHMDIDIDVDADDESED